MTTYYLLEKYRHVVVLRLSDEEVLKFKMDITPRYSAFLPLSAQNLRVNYVPIDQTLGTLEAIYPAGNKLWLVGNEMRDFNMDLYQPTRFRYTRPDGTVLVLNMSTGIESITDVYGNSISYDEAGIHSSSGASISFTRGEGNRIETITDPLGMTIESHSDEDGMLKEVVKSETEPYAVRKMNEYGYAQGVFEKPVLKEIKAPDGTVLGQMEYDEKGRMTALIDANGNRIIYGFNVLGHHQEITDRNGNVTAYAYNERNDILTRTGPNGNTTNYEYDAFGKLAQKTDADGNVTTYTRDANGNVLSETDALGNVTVSEYDAANRRTRTVFPDGTFSETAYDALGKKISETDPGGKTTLFGYNVAGNLISVTDALGNITQYTYDEAGNRLSHTDPNGNTETRIYDDLGRVISQNR